MNGIRKISEFWRRIRSLRTVSLRVAAPWGIWFALTVIWLATLLAMTHEGQYVQWIQAASVVLLLFILAFAEGLELAVTDLLDKEPEQLRDARLRIALRNLQQDPADFFSNRQLAVVGVITFTTLMTSYPWIYVPFVGAVSQEPLPGLFSFAWTTLTVLWFAQVTPKRLAIINSETFLGQSLFLLPLIKAVGYLGIPRASNQLVALFEKFTRYSEKRHLQPSASAYYNATGMKSGISVDRVDVKIAVNPDGSGTITRKSIVCFLQGKHVEHTEAIFCRAGLSDVPQLKVRGAYIGAHPERLETIAHDLDRISSRSQPSGRFQTLENWPHSIAVQRNSDAYYGGEWARWTIVSGRPLPEAYWHPDGLDQSIRLMIVLEYEVEIAVGPGGLTQVDDRNGRKWVWPEYIDIPTRMLRVAVTPASPDFDITLQGCDVRVLRNNMAVADETERCSDRAIASHDGCLEIAYPQQGAVYTVHWWQTGEAMSVRHAPETPSMTAVPNEKGRLLTPRLP